MPEHQDIKICAVLSCPMVGWQPHYGCTSEALRQLGIPLRLGYGAYWHHTLSNMLEDCVDEGLDWVLTLDYDSLFTARHLDNLIGRFGANSHIDALAALQCKRGTDEVPLLTCPGKSDIEINGQPVKVATAHFGLTLFRLDGFRKMPKPWFLDKPDPSGSYRSNQRTDADINFWHNWEAAGNTVFVDPMVIIGHIQPYVATFDEHYNIVHQHVQDWRKANQPAGAQ